MRSCLLGPRALWYLLLVVLVFLVFALPSFIKEPNTKPSRRYQYVEKIEERLQKWLRKAVFQASTQGWRTNQAEVEQETTVLDTQPGPTGHSAGASRSAGSSPAPRQELDTMPRATEDTQAPKGQDKETGGRRVSQQDKAETPALTRNITATTPRKEAGIPAAAAPATPPPPPPLNATTPRRQMLKASNFKSEPRWDFEEEYRLDVGGLHTKCPDSLKVKASKSGWLGKLFLPSPLLFLDSTRFSPSEWDRLEHFAPPFGFMELNHSLVRKVVTRFPPVPQQQLLLAGLPPGGPRCISCAVVGNGGILNNSRRGTEIDGHDYVFRLSGAVLKGYEQDVGTRTSFYGFTAFSLTQSLLLLGRRGFQHVPTGTDVRYLHFLEGTRDYEWLDALLLNETMERKSLFWFRRRPQEAFRDALKLDRYFLLHPDFLRYMKNRFLRSKTLNTTHWRIYRPTTGALLLLTALHLCDKVSAYGFITEGHERFSDHYYDTSWKRLIFYINHDFGLERTVWKRLHDEGIIWLYQRPKTTEAQKPEPGGSRP
ncbi:alpha-N-acetylgalactosaminide alpha-2,6-sialyltransferase 1 [Dipodomys merriami]|uniref:alpha-N-acetylgalactosaminide alpha-2,6-sialyltransferase 1 n=1 Tax=Dipodomys merriami TaxID=94247 RepID=UPI003855B85D